jgi:hypothetical protein
MSRSCFLFREHSVLVSLTPKLRVSHVARDDYNWRFFVVALNVIIRFDRRLLISLVMGRAFCFAIGFALLVFNMLPYHVRLNSPALADTVPLVRRVVL